MRAVLDVVLVVLDLYVWVLIVSALLSWLVAFNIVNARNGFVSTVLDILFRVTEPVLAPIRRKLPHMNGLDLSPIIVILLIIFAKSVIIRYIYPNVF
jgi:YggT family protein